MNDKMIARMIADRFLRMPDAEEWLAIARYANNNEFKPTPQDRKMMAYVLRPPEMPTLPMKRQQEINAFAREAFIMPPFSTKLDCKKYEPKAPKLAGHHAVIVFWRADLIAMTKFMEFIGVKEYNIRSLNKHRVIYAHRRKDDPVCEVKTDPLADKLSKE